MTSRSAPGTGPIPPRPLWLLRAAWVALPLLAGPALGAALDGRADGVRLVGTVLAWGGWTAVLVATLVPRATSLTVARIGGPAALAAAAWAVGPGAPGGEPGAGATVAAVAGAAVAWGLVLAPPVADAFVDGSSYGRERRFTLRCPPVLAVLAVAAWAVLAAGAGAGPLLLGARQWGAGGVATVVGLPAAGAAARALHGLSRRWLVFVPSGVVVHDPVARPDSVMVPRPLVARLGPAAAPAAPDALDLTLGAPGLALELETTEPLPVTVRGPGRTLATQPATRLLIAPRRAAAVLAEARARRLPVG